jgi:hypothetical protein
MLNMETSIGLRKVVGGVGKKLCGESDEEGGFEKDERIP